MGICFDYMEVKLVRGDKCVLTGVNKRDVGSGRPSTQRPYSDELCGYFDKANSNLAPNYPRKQISRMLEAIASIAYISK